MNDRARNLGSLSHVGYITVIFFLVGFLSVKDKHYAPIIVYSILGLLAFLFAIDSIVTRLFYFVPVFNKFRWPFKAMFFTSYSIVIVATFGCDIVFRKLQSLKHVSKRLSAHFINCIIALHFCAIVLLYTVVPQKLFKMHLDKVPFEEPLSYANRNWKNRNILSTVYRRFRVYIALYGFQLCHAL